MSSGYGSAAGSSGDEYGDFNTFHNAYTDSTATAAASSSPDGASYDPMTTSNAAAAAQHMLFSFYPGSSLFNPTTLAVLQQQQQQQSVAFHDSFASSQHHHHGLTSSSSSDPWSEAAAAAAYTTSSSSTTIPNDLFGCCGSTDTITGINSSSNEVFTIPHQPWLDELSIAVPDISVEPLSGTELLERIRSKCTDVLSHYIPCVSFLVECQQELRAGLEQPSRHRRCLAASQYYQLYIHGLPQQFVAKYSCSSAAAYADLQRLRQDAADAQRQGSEAVKANFLGGMKDGESWGLRKWLSKHGQGLGVCTDLECIGTALRNTTTNHLLDETAQQQLGDVVRPMADHVLQRLRNEIPASYQKHSTAHPYLPYFHRLEAALRNMARLYSPEEVICLDDSDDDDEIQVVVPPPPSRKRHREQKDDTDDDGKPPARKQQRKRPPKAAAAAAAIVYRDDDDASSSGESAGDEIEIVDRSPWPLPLDTVAYRDDAYNLGDKLYELAGQWDMNCFVRPPSVNTSEFWRGGNFGEALRLFGQLLQQNEIVHFVDRIDDDRCISAGHPPFSHIIKHPNIALRDVANSLFDQSGVLHTDRTLDHWNMFNAKDLLQAIDLVLLNSLAYTRVVMGGTAKQQSPPPHHHRSLINGLRKLLWNGIHAIGPPDKSDTPTRRTEQSGFVIYKIHTSRR